MKTEENETQLPMPSTLVIGGKAVDGRTLPAKRYKAISVELANDVGSPSTAQWLLIHRAAGLTVQLEMMESEIATGKVVDPGPYASLTGQLVRLLTTLGLHRVAKDVSPTIDPPKTLTGHAALVHNASKDSDDG
ncbi:MAG: hypothetical protein ACPGO3_05465 [Magnetospiraceae bacterium]